VLLGCVCVGVVRGGEGIVEDKMEEIIERKGMEEVYLRIIDE
jgi:hypothetical protein